MENKKRLAAGLGPWSLGPSPGLPAPGLGPSPDPAWDRAQGSPGLGPRLQGPGPAANRPYCQLTVPYCPLFVPYFRIRDDDHPLFGTMTVPYFKIRDNKDINQDYNLPP